MRRSHWEVLGVTAGLCVIVVFAFWVGTLTADLDAFTKGVKAGRAAQAKADRAHWQQMRDWGVCDWARRVADEAMCRKELDP